VGAVYYVKAKVDITCVICGLNGVMSGTSVSSACLHPAEFFNGGSILSVDNCLLPFFRSWQICSRCWACSISLVKIACVVPFSNLLVDRLTWSLTQRANCTILFVVKAESVSYRRQKSRTDGFNVSLLWVLVGVIQPSWHQFRDTTAARLLLASVHVSNVLTGIGMVAYRVIWLAGTLTSFRKATNLLGVRTVRIRSCRVTIDLIKPCYYIRVDNL
jgi:hypothetical protein